MHALSLWSRSTFLDATLGTCVDTLEFPRASQENYEQVLRL
jgi:hypothetical protein